MEQQLAANLGEGQIAEFVENDEVHPGQIVGDAALPAGAGFRLQPVDEVDGVEEASAQLGADAAARDGDGEMGLAGSGRSRAILPGIWRSKWSSLTHSIRDTVNGSKSRASSGMPAPIIWSPVNQMERCRYCRSG
jgi:hypothetical protein